MTKTCKVRLFGPLMLSRLFPGAKGDLEIVGLAYSLKDDHATITLKGDNLPDSEFANVHVTQARAETIFSPEVAQAKETA